MKKTIVILSGILFLAFYTIAPSFAQDDGPAKKKNNQNVVFGIEAGANFANMNVQFTGNTNSYNSKTGDLVGFVIDAPSSPSNQLYLQPGLFYMLNNTHVSGSEGTSNVSINTLELPVNTIFKTGHPGDCRFFIGVGLYAAYNMSGHSLNEPPAGSGTSANNYTFKIGSQNGVDDIQAFVFGLGMNTGIELPCGVYFRFRIQKGLSNMSPNEGTTINTSSIGLQAGYMFHNKGMDRGKGMRKEKVKKERTRSKVQED